MGKKKEEREGENRRDRRRHKGNPSKIERERERAKGRNNNMRSILRAYRLKREAGASVSKWAIERGCGPCDLFVVPVDFDNGSWRGKDGE